MVFEDLVRIFRDADFFGLQLLQFSKKCKNKQNKGGQAEIHAMVRSLIFDRFDPSNTKQHKRKQDAKENKNTSPTNT
jgi:hypothetical protein